MTSQEIILQLLEEKGMTKAQLAKKVGMAQPNLSRLLKGNSQIRKSTLEKISIALGIGVNYFSENQRREGFDEALKKCNAAYIGIKSYIEDLKGEVSQLGEQLSAVNSSMVKKTIKQTIKLEIPSFAEELKWASVCDVEGLKRFIFDNPTMPLVAYGDGGNYSPSFYFASLYSSYMGIAKAMSCFECSLLSDETIKHTKNIVVTSNGSSLDTKYAIKRCCSLNSVYSGAISRLSNTDKNIVKRELDKYNPKNNFDFEYHTNKKVGHSFISISKVVAMYAMIYKAFVGNVDFLKLNPTAERLSVLSNDNKMQYNLSDISRFVILYGGWSECVAKDIECKLVESSMGSATVTDYRNYCHGKFTIASNFDDLAIIMLITPRDKKLAEGIRNFKTTPTHTPIITIETEYDNPLASIDLLIKSSALIFQLGEVRGRHPQSTPPTSKEVDVRFPKNAVNYEQELKRMGVISLHKKEK